jgi:hypothetical protein
MKALLMVPMHYFSTFTLHRFLERVSRQYDIEFARDPIVCRVKGDVTHQGEVSGAAGALKHAGPVG